MLTNVLDERVSTFVRNLDEVLLGGLPKGQLTVLAGPPGSGKTILSQQIIFKNASPERPAVFFQTLSEPTAKTLRYLKQFKFLILSMNWYTPLRDSTKSQLDISA